MRNKFVPLTLVALTLGAALSHEFATTHAGPGGPLQDVTVNADTCWGTAPLAGPVCAGGTNTTTTSGTSTSYATAVTAYSSRLAQPVTYSPAVFASAVPADGTNVGDITARVDSGCNGGAGGADDILADDVAAAGTVPAWPAGWTGEEFLHESTPPGYLDAVKPFPASFSAVRVEIASLEQIWLNGTTPISITSTLGQRTPLAIVTENSSYNPALNVSYVQIGGQPSAPTSILCFDSPADYSARLTTETAPADGMYARWTIFTAALDLRTRNNIAMLVDLQCVTVGSAIADADGDCLPDTSDADDGDADQDNDGLVDGIESTFGSSQTAADIDLDGANDFLEMAQFTDHADSDTDDDGQLDLPDLGADEAFRGEELTDKLQACGLRLLRIELIEPLCSLVVDIDGEAVCCEGNETVEAGEQG